MDCSSAHIIEASRLATSLAALRERPRPLAGALRSAANHGLHGRPTLPLRLIDVSLSPRGRQTGDDSRNHVTSAPAGLEQQQKSLRLAQLTARSVLDLDLRQAQRSGAQPPAPPCVLVEIGWCAEGRQV